MEGTTALPPARGQIDFFGYWDSLGFFESLQAVLPPEFYVLFQIARIIFSEETTCDAFDAIEEISREEFVYKPDRKESIQVNRLERVAPVSDRMELDMFRKIYELKKALPRELAMPDEIFDMKLFTKTLMVQRFYESEADSFKPITTSRDQKGKDANRFEQKFYILLDRSPSMESKMRSFYSKCIVAEFLRRKLNSKAKLYYRPFDSKPGELMKVEKREDFPGLIEEVLLTTTGGKSTNIEAAIYRALKDIKFEKEMLNAEILVVTDGISKINRNKLRQDLKGVKLHVLKVGDDLPEPEYFDIEKGLKDENIGFDPSMINIREIHRKVKMDRGGANVSRLSITEKRIYRFIFDCSDKMSKDLRSISEKFVQIADLDSTNLYALSDETLEYIGASVERFEGVDSSDLEFNEKTRLYKQVHFLYQYVEMFLVNGSSGNQTLNQYHQRLFDLKLKLMKDPDIYFTFTQVKEMKEEKDLMKLAKKDMRQMLKKMQLEHRKLSIKEMRQGQLIFTMDVGGEGSMGQYLLLMFIKLMQFLKRVVTYPFRSRKGERAAARDKKEKKADRESRRAS
ncbi:MAG: hypothetical protein JXA20_02585 [Spirochaetes bacterium]|nr:hypothetical protein [Spirochaetota bacterium]